MPVNARRPPSAPPEVSFLEKLAYFAAPGTVVLGLLYYFGNQYNEAYYRAFGVPLSDLPISIQAVLARSPDALFFPVWMLLVCGLVVLLVLGRLGHALARPGNEGRRRTAYRALLAVGLLLGVVGGYPVFFRDDLLTFLPSGWPRGLLSALVVALGTSLAFFAIQVRLGQHDPGRRSHQARDADRLWLVAGALLLGMLTLSLFYGVSGTRRWRARRKQWRGLAFGGRGVAAWARGRFRWSVRGRWGGVCGIRGVGRGGVRAYVGCEATGAAGQVSCGGL
ncbi:hypothetical protein ACWGIU_07300 [Streptomyces sp. NPDC054840]